MLFGIVMCLMKLIPPMAAYDNEATVASVVMASAYVEVVFDRPLDTLYTYSVPEPFQSRVAIGIRVACPFGRGDTLTDGFIVGLSDTPPTRATKPIADVLDDLALVDDHLLKLTRWLADYYLCGWGQVLHAVVPAAVRTQAGTREILFIEAVAGIAERPKLSPKQSQALDLLHLAHEPKPLAHLARQLGGVGPLNALVEKGLARKFSQRVDSLSVAESKSEPAIIARSTPMTLNADQTQAWNLIEPALETGGYHPMLIHGVTGSGKTELYLRAIDVMIRQGKEAIVMVPEISLTPQTIDRFQRRGGRIAVLHSNLSNAERARYWRRVADGEIDVVVGARSAVFAPTRRLGLIVIDEEHESSFKQDSVPRYHGRDCAVMRARLANVPILLGSATPSLESWHNAHRSGGYTLVSLPNRVENRPLPNVKIVDLRYEPKTPGNVSPIGPTLERAVKETLRDGGQVILLLNRRGFNTHVHCPGCGHVAQCAHCDLSMTFHRNRAALVCHYCGWETAPFRQCPQCGAAAMNYRGMGTEKLEEEIAARFPDVSLARMDSDTTAKPGSHERVLDRFRDGQTKILLGTQMIAKGLDFPNVTLVGVINADVGLHLPDFRSAERTFQLLAQVAGRAGRGEKPGWVLIQTYTPEHPVIGFAAKHDYFSFAKQELEVRHSHGYPPYQRLARIVLRSEDANAVEAFAELMTKAFKNLLSKPSQESLRLLGPAECPVFRLNGFYRFHFQFQSSSSVRLHQVIREVIAVVKVPYDVECQIDIDPFSML
jgi:primosomal protein N' (replication factor Y) (superfamily II helicase)